MKILNTVPFLLLFSAASSYATTERSSDVFNQTAGDVTATVQFVNRKQIALSLENKGTRNMGCYLVIGTDGVTGATLLKKLYLPVKGSDVNAELITVAGMEEFGVTIRTLSCEEIVWKGPQPL
jgi:hypothetical protein